MRPAGYVKNDGGYLTALNAWTPKSIAGLAVWLRADMGVITGTGGVSEWIDQSGNWNSAAQTNSAWRPDLNASDSNLNSQPSLTFGASQAMDLALNETSSDWTVFSVAYVSSTSGTRSIMDDGASAMRYRAVSGNMTSWDGASQVSQTMAVGAHAICARHGASAGMVRVGASSTAGTLAAVAISNPKLGARNANSTADNWLSEIAEHIVYQSALSDTDVQAVMDYLGARYSVTV